MKGVLEFLEASRGGQSFLEQSTLLFLCAIREVSMSRSSQPHKQDSAFVSEWMGIWYDMKKKSDLTCWSWRQNMGKTCFVLVQSLVVFCPFFSLKKKKQKEKAKLKKQ